MGSVGAKAVGGNTTTATGETIKIGKATITVSEENPIGLVAIKDAENTLQGVKNALGGKLPATSTDYGKSVYQALLVLNNQYDKGQEFSGKWAQSTLQRMRLEMYGRVVRDAQSVAKSVDFDHPEKITTEIKRFYGQQDRHDKILEWINSKIK